MSRRTAPGAHSYSSFPPLPLYGLITVGLPLSRKKIRLNNNNAAAAVRRSHRLPEVNSQARRRRRLRGFTRDIPTRLRASSRLP